MDMTQRTRSDNPPGFVDDLVVALSELSGSEFVKFIAYVYSERGWDTEITPESHDDGVDIILTRNKFYPEKKLIQCKCNRTSNSLSRSSVQKYSYLLHQNDVDEVILLTTGDFTNPARKSAKKVNVKLVNHLTLMDIIVDTMKRIKQRTDNVGRDLNKIEFEQWERSSEMFIRFMEYPALYIPANKNIRELRLEKKIKKLISSVEDDSEVGAPIEEVLDRSGDVEFAGKKVIEHEIEELKRKGEVYEPKQDHLRVS